jgi:hypothetical protein
MISFEDFEQQWLEEIIVGESKPNKSLGVALRRRYSATGRKLIQEPPRSSYATAPATAESTPPFLSEKTLRRE